MPETPTRKILIVDDEAHIRTLLEQTLEDLEDEGVELLTATDGAAGLALVEAERPDLVFLDVMMPTMNGYEVCRAVRSDLGLTDVTIVLLTAKGQEADRRRAVEVGARVERRLAVMGRERVQVHQACDSLGHPLGGPGYRHAAVGVADEVDPGEIAAQDRLRHVGGMIFERGGGVVHPRQRGARYEVPLLLEQRPNLVPGPRTSA